VLGYPHAMHRTWLVIPLLLSAVCAFAGPPDREVDLSAEFGAFSGAFALYDSARGECVRYRPAECKVRTSPCSTFKIPNALIALDAGVASGPDFPLPWDGVKRAVEAWNRDQTLRSAFSASCVWYFQELARRVGLEPYARILPAIGYGNADVSGGLTRFWLESSLAISPDEQVEFLRRLGARQLPFSERSTETVLELMRLSEVGDVVLRGKTGTAGDSATGVNTMGWFVGILSRPSGDVSFATRITGGKDPSGRAARAITEAILAKLGFLPGARN